MPVGSGPVRWDDAWVPHRRELQGLRAVAVLLVVLDHAGLPYLQGGYVGVDVFFVLSGYLITGLLLRQARRDGRIRLSEFYVRRARRILPAAVLTLVVTDLVAHQLLNLVRARQAVSDSVWAAFFMANVHFAREGSDYFSQLQPPSPVQHYWTLAVEEQFYLVWPVALAARAGGARSCAGGCSGSCSPRPAPRSRGRSTARRPMHLRLLLDGHSRLGARARRGAGGRRATAARGGGVARPGVHLHRGGRVLGLDARSPATRRCCRRSARRS